MSDLHRAVQQELDAHRPAQVPPFATVLARKRARDRRRYLGAGLSMFAVAAIAATATGTLPGAGGRIPGVTAAGADGATTLHVTFTPHSSPAGVNIDLDAVRGCAGPEADITSTWAKYPGYVVTLPDSADDDAAVACLQDLQLIDTVRRIDPLPAEGASAPPPERLTVDGLEFLRRDKQPFVLRPAVREGDATGIVVTVPATHAPDGKCAVHYEPVISAQDDDGITLATWRYTPEHTGSLDCAGVGHGDRTVRLDLQRPLGDRPVAIDGRNGTSLVYLLAPGPDGGFITADLAPADPSSAEICLDQRCVTVTDRPLLRMSAEAINRALRVRAGDECSDAGRNDNVDRTYRVRFATPDGPGVPIDVPLGCSPVRVAGGYEEYALDSGGPDVIRIAYDQQISPDNQCLGIGGPSGGPETKDYVGLTLEQAEQRAAATNNDVIRIAGRDGACTGIVRDHVINRVNIYLEDGIVTAAHSF